MRIAIPTDKKGSLEDEVALHFGQAKNFLIYDTKNKSFVIEPNPEAIGSNELPPDFLSRKKTKAIIVFGLGPAAYKKFTEYQIKMFKAVKGTIAKNIENFKNKKLRFLTKKDTL